MEEKSKRSNAREAVKKKSGGCIVGMERTSCIDSLVPTRPSPISLSHQASPLKLPKTYRALLDMASASLTSHATHFALDASLTQSLQVPPLAGFTHMS